VLILSVVGLPNVSGAGTPVITSHSGIGSVKLTWNQDPDVLYYEVWRDGNLIGKTFDLYYTDTGLVDGTSYEYKIVAINMTGNKTESAPVRVTPGEGGIIGKWAWLMAIIGGLVQLVLGVGLAIVSIYLGLNVLTKLIPTVKIWEEIKKGNYAVGVVCAGVVIAYTQVLNTGIRGMAAAVSTNPSFWGFVAGLLSILFGILFASLGVSFAFKALDKLTKDIEEPEELNKKNLAVGILIAGILYGVSSMIAAAVSGIGPAIAAGLEALFK